jgi:tRNA threonylcarbamoyl adenosine modification protein YeaZ
MNLLCWDTCGETISITLVKENRFVLEKKKERSQEKGPSSFLLPFLVQACKEANLSFREIDCFGVTQGPGSLTGIKLGLSAAYGLSCAFGKPVYGKTLFELWKKPFQKHFSEDFFCLLVDTYGSTFATQLYGPGGCSLKPPGLHTFSSLETFFIENDLPLKEVLIGGIQMNPRKKPVGARLNFVEGSLLEISSSRLLAEKILSSPLLPDCAPVEPFYLYPPAVKFPQNS